MPAGIFDSSSGTIWNHDNGYVNPSATELANQNNFFQNLLDPTGLVSGFWNDLTGVTSQSREFSQQEYLQDKMNEYNLPGNQMARMKAAGINPNTAASGISQGGSESAQAPSVASNVGGAANGLASAAGAVASLGAGTQAFAAANETNVLLALHAGQIRSETVANLEKAGVDHWNALSVATLLPTMQANQVADFYLKMAQFDNTRQQYQLLLDEHELNLKNIEIAGSQAEIAAENARFAKAETDFFVTHGYRDDSPLDVSLRNCLVSGRHDEAGAIAGAIEISSNRSAYGQFKADADTAYERAFNAAQGSNDGSAGYQSFLNDLEIYKANVTGFMQMWYSLPDSLKGFAAQWASKILAGGSAVLGGVDKKPKYNPTKIGNDEFVKHSKRRHGFSGRW